jgi:hypothetical protein
MLQRSLVVAVHRLMVDHHLIYSDVLNYCYSQQKDVVDKGCVAEGCVA